MSMRSTIVQQFGKPSGLLGQLMGFVMKLRPSNRRRSLFTLELLDIRPDDHVFEIGFGPGLSTARAAQLASLGKVVGMDHSELMLAQAKRRNAAAIRASRVELHLGGAEANRRSAGRRRLRGCEDRNPLDASGRCRMRARAILEPHLNAVAPMKPPRRAEGRNPPPTTSKRQRLWSEPSYF